MKILIILLFPIICSAQITHDTVYFEPVGKTLRQAGQMLAISVTIGIVAEALYIVHKSLSDPYSGMASDLLFVSTVPFLVIGVNKLFEAGRRQELIDNYYIYEKK